MATERWTDATRTARRMGSGAHSKFQGIPVASRICPSRQRRVFRLHQIQPLLIHSQHQKKKPRAWQQFRSVRCRRETFHAEIGTFKWPSERAGQRQGKLSRHYSNSVFVSPSRSLPSPVRRCLPSLTLTCSQTELPSTHGNSCEETVLSVERGQIPHGGGGGGPAREENCGPGQRVEIREEKWLPFEPSVTSQLHTKPKSRLSRTGTDNLPLTLL